MILKVKQPDTDKWFYYDKVRLFKIRRSKRDINEPYEDTQIVLLSKERDPRDCVATADLNFEDGQCLEVLFIEGYLLNDVGETIERL